MAKKQSSTLFHKEELTIMKTTSKASANIIKSNRSKSTSVKKFVTEIVAGNISYLSRAITLVESTNRDHQKKANEILKKILNIGKNLNGHVLILDLLNLNFRKVKLKKINNV